VNVDLSEAHLEALRELANKPVRHLTVTDYSEKSEHSLNRSEHESEHSLGNSSGSVASRSAVSEYHTDNDKTHIP
jgi:hypothetical protein